MMGRNCKSGEMGVKSVPGALMEQLALLCPILKEQMLLIAARYGRLLSLWVLPLVILGFLPTTNGHAEDYPSRPIRMVVGYAPGGSTDVSARAITQELSQNLGQQIIVENRPGAGATIATGLVATAPADGYTLLMVNVSHTVNPALRAKVPYDPIKSFSGVSMIATIAQLLVVHPSVPAKSLKDLVRLAKARPNDLNFGSGGVGSSAHMAMELLKQAAKIEVTHVPYKSGGLVASGLLSGEVACAFMSIPSAVSFVKSGRIRALAVTSPQRSPSMPNIPTIAESGYPGFSAIGYVGLVVPAGTPKQIIDRLHGAVVYALSLPQVKERFLALGLSPVGGTPQGFDEYIKADLKKWRKLIREDLKLPLQ